MARTRIQTFITLIILSMVSGGLSAEFTVTNECGYPVWPGLLSNAGTPQLPVTGFALQPGESNTFTAPASWSGRMWGRTSCTQNSGKLTCLTGDCGTSTVQCSGNGAALPVTLAEFTLNGAGGLDFFDVSLVDGYNLPLLITPKGGTGQGNCTSAGCLAELNQPCPTELQVYSNNGDQRSTAVACKSACLAFGSPEYCCRGPYGTPDVCKPSSYSQFFKSACPQAYSYAYDDGTSTFTCAAGADYDVTFCPSSPSNNIVSPSGQSTSPAIAYGEFHYSGAISMSASFIAMITGVVAASWLLFVGI